MSYGLSILRRVQKELAHTLLIDTDNAAGSPSGQVPPPEPDSPRWRGDRYQSG
jgi:hypothetical protein